MEYTNELPHTMFVFQENQSSISEQEFGTEADVERLIGRKKKTLQKDRCLGKGLPFYRFGRRILYDLNEVREFVRAGRVEVSERRDA